MDGIKLEFVEVRTMERGGESNFGNRDQIGYGTYKTSSGSELKTLKRHKNHRASPAKKIEKLN